MNPLLKLEQDGDSFKLVAKDYIPKNTLLGITHIKREYTYLKTAMGEFITHDDFPNCMLLVEPEELTLWTVKSVFIGDTVSINTNLYNL